ncbi:MAG: efflux RND transporter periplasmic adaptor subunit, partial [Pseudomonadota bacterium]
DNPVERCPQGRVAQIALSAGDHDCKPIESSLLLITPRPLDERRLTVEQRRQQIIQNESMIAIERSRRDQQQAALDRLAVVVSRAERDLSNTTLRAPFDGIVAGPDAEIGRLVSANDHVATLYARGGSEVRFTLTEADYAGLVASGESLIGRPINVVWSANGTLAPFPAEISRIAPEIDASRGSVALYADLSVEPEALRPGAFVEVRVQDRVYDDVAALPQTALYGTGTVYVIVDGRLLPRAVEVVGRDSGTLLLSGDLADGDDVLVSRITEAGDGLAVDIVARP